MNNKSLELESQAYKNLLRHTGMYEFRLKLRIVEWPGLEEALKITQFQPSMPRTGLKIWSRVKEN